MKLDWQCWKISFIYQLKRFNCKKYWEFYHKNIGKYGNGVNYESYIINEKLNTISTHNYELMFER